MKAEEWYIVILNMLDMLNNEFIPFQTVTIRPHWGQFCINEFPGILLCIAGYWVSRFTDFDFHEFLYGHPYSLPSICFSGCLHGKD